MSFRNCITSTALSAALCVMLTDARAQDLSKYPDWKGQWSRLNTNQQGQAVKFDPSKPSGPGQEAPLTPEYQKVLEESMADQAKGGIGNYPTALCVPGGMPRIMSPTRQEYVITPETTYILTDLDITEIRRIYTDGRDWPTDIQPSYQGYSIGRWIDEDGDGKYDVLEIDTRGPFNGPRAYDHTGLPLHFDNQSTFKERIYLDKANPNILHDEITVFDHALTRPWGVHKTFRRNPNPRPIWPDANCSTDNAIIKIGAEIYFMSADGLLMPAKKDQAPPDLRYFKEPRK
jgi:hypothetical protein